MDLYHANVSQDSSVNIVTRKRTGSKGNRLLFNIVVGIIRLSLASTPTRTVIHPLPQRLNGCDMNSC